MLDFLNGFLNKWMPVDRKMVRLREVGVGRDYKRLRLKGASCISLKRFKDAWSQVYYKDDLGVTRFEHHLKIHLPLDVAIQSFKLPDDYVSPYGNGRPDERRDFV